MTEKQINRLLMIGYAGIVLAYGILLWAKLKPNVFKNDDSLQPTKKS